MMPIQDDPTGARMPPFTNLCRRASMPTSNKATSSSDDSAGLLRSIISLALCIHLVCVAAVLASNFRRSALQARLVSIFAAYTKLLNFDPNYTPYYYTLGRPADDDTRLVIDLYPSAEQPVAQQQITKSLQLPEGGSAWLGERRRGIRLAQLLADNAAPESENEDITSEIARSVGGRALRTTECGRAVVRCMRRMSQPYDLATLNPGYPADRPTDIAYDTTIYEADVWLDEDKRVQVQKRVSRAEAAPRQSGPATRGAASTP
jgi:hypothetical protein